MDRPLPLDGYRLWIRSDRHFVGIEADIGATGTVLRLGASEDERGS